MAGVAFDLAHPPAEVTNPNHLQVSEYPKHLHKFAGLNEDGSPKLNRFVVVGDALEEAKRLAEGWSLTPVLEAPEGEVVEDDAPKRGKKAAK
jgi:hypothetical protein